MSLAVRTFALVVLATSALAGCAAEEDAPLGQGEDGYHSKPTGTGQTPASLSVSAPAPAQGSFWYGSQTKKLGETMTALLPDPNAAWSVRGAATCAGSTSACLSSDVMGTSTLVANTAMNVRLSAVRAKYAGTPRTHGLGSEVPARSMIQRLELGSDLDIRGGFTVLPTSDGASAVPVAAGRYLLTWGLDDGLVVDAKRDELTSVDLSSFAGRRTVRIVPPAARDLPNACSESAYVFSGGSMHAPINLSSPVIVGQSRPVQELLKQLQNPVAGEPELMLPCNEATLKLPLGVEGEPAKDLRLGRIDVDDVQVKLPDGSTEMRRGSYMVYSAANPTVRVVGLAPTNTGVDLPAGTYKLVVQYKNNLNQYVTYAETFTTP